VGTRRNDYGVYLVQSMNGSAGFDSLPCYQVPNTRWAL